MAVEDQPPFAAGHGVLRREAVAAAVASGREGGGWHSESEADPVSELLGREVGSVEEARPGGEPRASRRRPCDSAPLHRP